MSDDNLLRDIVAYAEKHQERLIYNYVRLESGYSGKITDEMYRDAMLIKSLFWIGGVNSSEESQ